MPDEEEEVMDDAMIDIGDDDLDFGDDDLDLGDDDLDFDLDDDLMLEEEEGFESSEIE